MDFMNTFFFLVFVCLRECACVCGCVCMCVCIKKFRYKVACQSLCSHCCLPLLYTSFLNNTRTNLAHSIFLHPALLSFPPPIPPHTHLLPPTPHTGPLQPPTTSYSLTLQVSSSFPGLVFNSLTSLDFLSPITFVKF